jgi:DNA-binding response OmpR family regulator
MAKILVVDDDPKIRSSLRRTLAFDGYTVREAGDGREALTAMLDELPDLVLLDLMLPGTDGLEVCRRFREMSDVPIVMLTRAPTTTWSSRS